MSLQGDERELKLRDLEICWKIYDLELLEFILNSMKSHLVGELGETAFFT